MSSPWTAPRSGDADAAAHVAPPPPGPASAPAPPGTAAAGDASSTGFRYPRPGDGDDPFAAPPDDSALRTPAVRPAPGPGHPGPMYGYPVAPGTYGPAPVWPTLPGNDPMAVAALVVGLVATVGSLIFPLPIGPVALGLGIASLVRIRRRGLRGRGMAIAGIVLGAVSTVFLLLAVAVMGLVFSGLLLGL